MSPSITINAPAKLNLHLHITGKMPNGYHRLESLSVFLELYDDITLTPAEDVFLEIQGDFAETLNTDDAHNHVLRAAMLLLDKAQHTGGVKLILNKRIPIGAGLGGGSSDAASTLRALNDYWKLEQSSAELHHLGAKIGSDVPLCLQQTPTWVSGTGEQLTSLHLPCALYAVVIFPNHPLSTKDVYAGVTQDMYREEISCPTFEDKQVFIDWLKNQSNDLQTPAMRMLPQLQDISNACDAIDTALCHRMTGSGSAWFLLFDDWQYAIDAGKHLAMTHTDWWVRTASILEGDRYGQTS